MLILKEGSERHKGILNRARNAFLGTLSEKNKAFPDKAMEDIVALAKQKARELYDREIKNSNFTEWPNFDSPEIDTLAENYVRGNDGRLDTVRAEWNDIKKKKKVKTANKVADLCRGIRRLGYKVNVVDGNVEVRTEPDVGALLTRLNELGYKVTEVERTDGTVEEVTEVMI